MATDETATDQDERGGLPSASGMERLCLCPGSWQAEARCADEPESDDAKMGTRLHACMENHTKPDDAEELEAVKWCYEMEDALIDELIPEYRQALLEDESLNFPLPKARERRLFDAAVTFSGKADCVFCYGEKALIVDYKFGRGDVTRAVGNLQLAVLAVVLADHFPQVQVFYAAILQPFASKAKPEVVCFSRLDVEKARGFFAAALAAAHAENPPLRAGVKQCHYCRAAAGCPAYALTMQRGALADLSVWETLTPELRRQAYDWALMAKRAYERIMALLKDDLRAGKEIPGLSLTQGKKSFTVKKPGEAFALLCSRLGVSAEEFSACCKVNVKPLDSLVHAKIKEQNPAQTVMGSRDWLRATLADCGEMSVSEGSIKKGGKA